ncbi:MAG: riboflavin kinase [Candidatus Doudnabacteria bacterium]|nr:riboflavin kinase [Candidatus Doudnabacteria bacterium]
MTSISGKVIKHLGRGKRLSYPTANLDAKIELPEGIYLGLVKNITGGKLPPLFLRKLLPHAKLFKNTGLPALIFIGKAETFDETKTLVEVHILDFSQEIYGCELEVEIIKKIRDNQKFETKEALIDQMKDDELQAREFFKI